MMNNMIKRISVINKIINNYTEEINRNRTFAADNIMLGSNVCISEDSLIGSYTYIGNNSCVEDSTIGRYVSIGDNVTIAPGEHRILQISTSYRIYNNRIGKSYYNGDFGHLEGGVEIGNDVWIGCNVTIRRKVRIGNGAVIGANSYINKDIPPFAVVGGVPMRIIKYRFDNHIIEEIEKSAWWDHDLDEARVIISQLEKNLGIQKVELECEVQNGD